MVGGGWWHWWGWVVRLGNVQHFLYVPQCPWVSLFSTPAQRVHAAVTDVDARVVVGEQWIIDPAYVRDTGESLGSGSNGTVKKGLLYDHVPVALKVR